DGVRHRIAKQDAIVPVADSTEPAKRRAGHKTPGNGGKNSGRSGEAGHLPEPAAEPIDGEDLTISGRVLSERVGRGEKERARPGGVREAGEGIHAAEVRQLNKPLAGLKKDLRDREVRGQSRWRAHRDSGKRQAEQGGAAAEYAEARDDLAARRRDGSRDGLQSAAVDPDRERSESVVRIRAVGVDEGLEHHRIVVDEDRAAGQKELPVGIARWRAGGEV